MSKFNARCQLHMWDHLHALNIELGELSLVLGCASLIKLVG